MFVAHLNTARVPTYQNMSCEAWAWTTPFIIKCLTLFFIDSIQQEIIIGLSDHNLALAVPELFFDNSWPEPVNVKDFEPNLTRYGHQDSGSMEKLETTKVLKTFREASTPEQSTHLNCNRSCTFEAEHKKSVAPIAWQKDDTLDSTFNAALLTVHLLSTPKMTLPKYAISPEAPIDHLSTSVLQDNHGH